MAGEVISAPDMPLAGLKALAPAMANCSSCAALAAPLTPTPPTTWLSAMTGTPPMSGVKSLSAVITVRPLPLELMSSSKKRVGRLNCTAVRALPMEMLAPAAKVPSRRSSAIRLPPSSTTAMTPPGAFSFCASALAVAMTLRAPSRVRVFFSATWAEANPAAAQLNAANISTLPKAFRISIPFCRRLSPLAQLQPAGWERLLQGLLERRFAEQGLGPGAPDLHLDHVFDVGREHNRLVELLVLVHLGLFHHHHHH